MLEAKFSHPKHWFFVYGAMVLLLATISAAIWWGPLWVYRGCLVGGVFSLTAILLSILSPSRFAPWLAGLATGGLFLVLFFVGLSLDHLFLKPLNDSALKIPPLIESNTSPGSLFSMIGPDGWTFEKKSNAMEEGFIMRPGSKDAYMGISEAYVYVRPVEKAFREPEKFLAAVANNFNTLERGAGKDRVFGFRTEPAQLISGGKGMWSVLDIKKFWVPLREVTLLGIKNKRYLCSVSAVGLASHATLYKVFCLGIFETIKLPKEGFPT